MAPPKLRVYFGPESAAEPNVPQQLAVPLGEVLPALVEASMDQRMWLDDFVEEEITISADLYEVVLAYQRLRRPSA